MLSYKGAWQINFPYRVEVVSHQGMNPVSCPYYYCATEDEAWIFIEGRGLKQNRKYGFRIKCASNRDYEYEEFKPDIVQGDTFTNFDDEAWEDPEPPKIDLSDIDYLAHYNSKNKKRRL